jgi:G2/mitotic-specific cyclin 3/4
MLAVGGFKAAAKRTAFGDVSNTAKSLATVHDDSVLPGKSSVHADFVKPLAHQEKPAAFLRPAQRPLNVAPIKGPLNTTSSTSSEQVSISAASKAPLAAPRHQLPQLPPLKRAQSKKLTSIYKDSSAENEQQAKPAVNLNTRPESAPVPPVHQSLEPRQHKSQPQLKAEQPPIIRKTQNKYFDAQPPSQGSENVSPTEPIYEDAREDQGTISADAYESYLRLVNEGKEEESVNATHEKLDRQHRHLPAPPSVSEPEEYWEDEEEEIYDEQGYTTAHSYRSKGDNTTGGATTVLFPKVTNKAKKEIAAATELFLSSRTQEDIEEDEWDTSMVTEYGDEIFAYMRELEVSLHEFLASIL